MHKRGSETEGEPGGYTCVLACLLWGVLERQ